VFVPLTHQLMPQDRATCTMIEAHDSLRDRTPVVLGGHEHEVYIEPCGASTIVKVGAEAELLGIVDIWWDETGKICSEISTQPCSEFDQDPLLQSFVEKKQSQLNQAMDTPIAFLKHSMSSERVRFEPSDLASFLLSSVKRGLKEQGVELAMIQGGAVRAMAHYEPGPFTMGDLFKEFAFDCNQAVIQLPGHIISRSAIESRSGAKPAPNFLHFDQQVIFDAEGAICEINGEPFDAERLYTVSVYHFLVSGGNQIEPLLSYVRTIEVPDEEACLPVKNIVLEDMMKTLWRRVLSYEEHCEQFEQHLHKVFDEMDTDGNGLLDPSELMRFFGAKLDGDHPGEMLMQMIKSLDANGDGKIERSELEAIIF